MAVKTTGAEWKRFYADPEYWPEGVWYEDECLTVNGEQECEDHGSIDDAAVVAVSDGVVHLRPEDKDGPSLEAYFRRWRKAQTMSVHVVLVPKAKADEFASLLKQLGGSVDA